MSPLAFSPGGARLSSSQDNGTWLPLSAVLFAASCSRGLEVDALDGAAKGEGETDEEADAMWGRGAVSFVSVGVLDALLRRKALSTSFSGNRMSRCTKAEDEDDAFGCTMACWCFVSNGNTCRKKEM
jgi:hypothetical protein